jgi:16S rRNA (cytosine967-C5)-methyltransferase
LDGEVLATLRIAVAELASDANDQVHATVNESVEAVRELGKPRAAGFVNAVLRRLSREGLPEDGDSPAVALAVPDWLYDAVLAAHGYEETQLLLAGLRQPGPATPIRVRPGGRPPQDANPVPGIEGAYYADGPVQTGHRFTYSDAASTAVGLALRSQPGERVLDVASAPGGKTLHLWDLAGGKAEVVALDRHRRRIRSAQARLADSGATPRWVNGDGRRLPFGDSVFDATLVDAPCTGLGTLRRRPEIAMRLNENSPRTLAAEQKKMLKEAWRVTRTGGRIVYSVCTVFPTETVDIVSDYPASAPIGLPGRKWGNGLLLAPHLTGTDGMFISLIERTDD